MTKRKADDAAENFRADVGQDLRSAAVHEPEDFGLRFLTVDELIARAESSPTDELAERRTGRKVIATGAGIAAAAAVSAALVLPRIGDNESPPNATPSGPSTSATATPSPVEFDSARDVLIAASGVAGPSTGSIRYWHVKSVLHAAGQPDTPRDVWFGNGRASIVQQNGFVDRLPTQAIAVAGRHLGWTAVQNLPPDAAALRRILGSDPSPKSDDEGWNIFYAAGELVAEAPLSPDVRSAVWRVLADIPGARQTERTTDSIGRVGWTVSKASADEGLLTYVVAPESGQLLELRHSAVGARPAWSVTFIERGPVDSAPAVDKG